MLDRVKSIESKKIDCNISEDRNILGCHSSCCFGSILFHYNILYPMKSILYSPMVTYIPAKIFSIILSYTANIISCFVTSFITNTHITFHTDKALKSCPFRRYSFYILVDKNLTPFLSASLAILCFPERDGLFLFFCIQTNLLIQILLVGFYLNYVMVTRRDDRSNRFFWQ